MLKILFIPFSTGRRARTPHDVDILIRLRIEVP